MKIRTTESIISDIADSAAQTARWHFDSAVGNFTSRCESPIECVLAAALIHAENFEIPKHGHQADFSLSPIAWFNNEWRDYLKTFSSGRVYFAQAGVGDYRADFLLCLNTLVRESDDFGDYKRVGIVIECDGHDTHERTKEQARHDRSRDRWMQANGLHVMRFTGSEIWGNPFLCAEEVTNFAGKLEDEIYAAGGAP